MTKDDNQRPEAVADAARQNYASRLRFEPAVGASRPCADGGIRLRMSVATSFTGSPGVVVHHESRSTMASDWTDAVVVTGPKAGWGVACRKHGGTSEAARSRKWSTLEWVKGMETPSALKGALDDTERLLNISLKWDAVITQVAKLDWSMAVALAQLSERAAPAVPQTEILWAQGVLHKNDVVTLSVECGYEIHSIELSLDRWIRLCKGKVPKARSRGHYEGTSFWNWWTFRLGEEESLTVEYGQDGGVGFNGNITDAMLNGPRPHEVDVAQVILDRALRPSGTA